MFHNIKFPDNICYDIVNSIIYDTNIIKSKNGREQRIINFSSGKNLYKLIYKFQNKNEIEKIVNIFNIVKGRANGFRFKDWFDYRIEKQQIAIDDARILYLYKDYRIDNVVYRKRIYKPVENSIEIFINGEKDNSIIKFVDYDNGTIEFYDNLLVNSGNKIEISCEFDIPVRFNSDKLNIITKNKNQYETEPIELIEIENFK